MKSSIRYSASIEFAIGIICLTVLCIDVGACLASTQGVRLTDNQLKPAPLALDQGGQDFPRLYAEWEVRRHLMQRLSDTYKVHPSKELEARLYEMKAELLNREPIISRSAKSAWIREPKKHPDAARWLRSWLCINAVKADYAKSLEFAKVLLHHPELLEKDVRIEALKTAARSAFNLKKYDLSSEYYDQLQRVQPLEGATARTAEVVRKKCESQKSAD